MCGSDEQENWIDSAHEGDTDVREESDVFILDVGTHTHTRLTYIATSTVIFESVPEIATEINLQMPSPVLVEFCADCEVNTGVFDWGQLTVRATVDGTPIDPSPAASPTIAWSSNGKSDNGLLRAHCFDWLASSVEAGVHVADVEWALNPSGGGIASCHYQTIVVRWGAFCTTDEVDFCNDGFDNDCDGGTDCNDADCAADPSCGPPCGDGFCDPATEDPCACAADCGTPPGSESGLCTDGIDNDCDGDTDCNDADCATDHPRTCKPKGASCTLAIECCSGVAGTTGGAGRRRRGRQRQGTPPYT